MSVEIRHPDDLLRVLEQRRAERGETRSAVSERAGFSHASYWYWSRTRGKVTFEAALCYAQALGLQVIVRPNDDT
jgi:hypothetical protein